MNLDHDLRDALRRKQAPADLADRVLARINEGPARSPSGRARVERCAALAGCGGRARHRRRRRRQYYEHQHQAAETARVQQDLRIALQITSETLARVQSKLSQPAENGGR